MGTVTSTAVAQTLRTLAAQAPISLRVSGDCMSPLIEDGALIRVARRRFYWPGDALVIRAHDGRLLVHRLLGGYLKSEWRWLTRADNAQWPDAAVSRERIIGKVCGGECAGALIRAPLAQRWRSLAAFIRFGLATTKDRLRRRIATS